jgi:hypothetical protein
VVVEVHKSGEDGQKEARRDCKEIAQKEGDEREREKECVKE